MTFGLVNASFSLLEWQYPSVTCIVFFFNAGTTMAFRTNIQENFFPVLKSEIIICRKLLS